MSILTLHTRSFHPDEAFGLGGLGFKGDNRGFSSDTGATARIFHRIAINLRAAEFGKPECRSDPSANWALGKIGIDVSNDYSEKRKQPRHSEDPKSITPYRQDGDQAVNIKITYAGQNFAFPGANLDWGHSFYSTVVPDLDVTNEVSLRINRPAGKATVTCRISGDGFPNCESFLIDSGGNVLFLASHIRVGTAATQLPGGRAISMCSLLMDVDWNQDDTFGSSVRVQFAHDYAGSGGPFELAFGQMSRSEWNQKHTGRDASGPTIRQIEDNFPIPTLISPAY